ncbi:unnamed protein product [Arabis nemorensis]|uniref:Phospho-2-dehydro-3-deoxyheptonate aldolase n=1 Tax=Arabis nemorensis TaxID=586526 RepID=A0A565C565_9BRAS|nr:unnamed protein product [Arabis nemorensis]
MARTKRTARNSTGRKAPRKKLATKTRFLNSCCCDLNRYRELANRVDEALGFMGVAGLTNAHPIMTTTKFWTFHECLLLPYEQYVDPVRL